MIQQCIDRLERASGQNQVSRLVAEVLEDLHEVSISDDATESDKQTAVRLRGTLLRRFYEHALHLRTHGNPTNEELRAMADQALAIGNHLDSLTPGEHKDWRKATEAIVRLLPET